MLSTDVNTRIFLATIGHGMARAKRGVNGEWTVNFSLDDRDIRCLAADPLNRNVVYAGAQDGDVWHSANYGDTCRQLPFNLGGIHRSLIIV